MDRMLHAVLVIDVRRALNGVEQEELAGLLEELAHLRVGLYDDVQGAVRRRLGLHASGELALVGVEYLLLDDALALPADLPDAVGVGVDVVVADTEEVVARLAVEPNRLLREGAAHMTH